MAKYILKRLLLTLPLLLMITVAVFSLLQLTPGDPLDAYLPPNQTLLPEQKASLRHTLGLDQPPVLRYFFWLLQTLRGNLGFRTKDFQPISETIGSHIGPTLLLMGTALILGVTVGIALGVLSAIKHHTYWNHFLTLVAFVGISTPVFLAGLFALEIFGLQLNWFPTGGFSTPGQLASVGDVLHHLILPAVVVSLTYAAPLLRYTRSSLLEVMSQDYVRTAQAKGLRESRVVTVHALRNALLPLITVVGANIPSLLAGAVFTETIFSWPGLGQLFLEAVEERDYNLVLGLTLILATLVLLATLLTDILYTMIDPRIRYDRKELIK